MLLDLKKLKEKYNLNVKGVLHIGAHFGQEYLTYESIGVKNIIFFEPLPVTFNKLVENIDGRANCVNVALGNEIKDVEMFVETANQGQSSSVLEPALHTKQYPHIKFQEKVTVPMTTLDAYMKEGTGGDYNFINIDVQGYELEVFKGAKDTLNNIDYIMTEVNRDEVYKDCAKIEELDTYLGNYGFQRVETTWDGGTWGDAFYVKNNG